MSNQIALPSALTSAITAPVAIATSGQVRKFSEYQERIFRFALESKRSGIVIAVAGAGKTTTMMEMLHRLPSTLAILVLAFNKSIALEFKARIPANAQGATFNSVGHRAWAKYIGKNLTPDSGKTRAIMRDLLSPRDLAIYGSFVAKMVGLAKSVGMTCLVPDVESEWAKLAVHHDVTPDTEGATVQKGIELARMILKQSINEAREVIDFDDQLFMPLIENVAFPKFDLICIDEAQDTNGVQRALLKRMMNQPNGRIIAVGDPKQAIYGFRGADSSAMELIRQEFDCEELPLTVSYRCPQAVVRKAQELVPYIQASDSAPVGLIAHNPGSMVDGKFVAQPFRWDDAIICRNSAPLVALAYDFIGKQIPCQVLGRDIGKGLTDLVKKMNAKGIDALLEKLSEYARREIDKLTVKDQAAQAEALRDKVDCIDICINALPETSRTVPALILSIESLFSDSDKGVLTLCTVHKAKGLEWERVYILDADKLMPSKWAKRDWQKEQEINLMYVAYTRSKLELYFVDTDFLMTSVQRQEDRKIEAAPKQEVAPVEVKAHAKEGYISVGDVVEVVKGRKVPIGTKGTVVKCFGEPWFAILIKDERGTTHMSYVKNVVKPAPSI